MNFNFDMHHIGQTIGRLRREHNMTQMQLADEMGVSFQAVSNWERGQSMPDISKLPELAELWGTTIDALLGRSIPLVEKAAKGKLDEFDSLSVEEVAEVAPLLPPKQIDGLTDRLMKMDNLSDMAELLPFLPTEKVDGLLRQKAADGGDPMAYVPFASTSAVDEVALAMQHQEQSIALIPFMSQKTIDSLTQSREANGHSISDLVPFLSSGTLNAIVFSRLQSGKSISALLPFISQDTLQQLFSTSFTKP